MARMESPAALAMSASDTAGAAAAGLGAPPPLAGLGAGSIWVGSSAAVRASVSESGQRGLAQLGPLAVVSRSSNQLRQPGSTELASVLYRRYKVSTKAGLTPPAMSSKSRPS